MFDDKKPRRVRSYSDFDSLEIIEGGVHPTILAAKKKLIEFETTDNSSGVKYSDNWVLKDVNDEESVEENIKIAMKEVAIGTLFGFMSGNQQPKTRVYQPKNSPDKVFVGSRYIPGFTQAILGNRYVPFEKFDILYDHNKSNAPENLIYLLNPNYYQEHLYHFAPALPQLLATSCTDFHFSNATLVLTPYGYCFISYDFGDSLAEYNQHEISLGLALNTVCNQADIDNLPSVGSQVGGRYACTNWLHSYRFVQTPKRQIITCPSPFSEFNTKHDPESIREKWGSIFKMMLVSNGTVEMLFKKAWNNIQYPENVSKNRLEKEIFATAHAQRDLVIKESLKSDDFQQFLSEVTEEDIMAVMIETMVFYRWNGRYKDTAFSKPLEAFEHLFNIERFPENVKEAIRSKVNGLQDLGYLEKLIAALADYNPEPFKTTLSEIKSKNYSFESKKTSIKIKRLVTYRLLTTKDDDFQSIENKKLMKWIVFIKNKLLFMHLTDPAILNVFRTARCSGSYYRYWRIKKLDNLIVDRPEALSPSICILQALNDAGRNKLDKFVDQQEKIKPNNVNKLFFSLITVNSNTDNFFELLAKFITNLDFLYNEYDLDDKELKLISHPKLYMLMYLLKDEVIEHVIDHWLKHSAEYLAENQGHLKRMLLERFVYLKNLYRKANYDVRYQYKTHGFYAFTHAKGVPTCSDFLDCISKCPKLDAQTQWLILLNTIRKEAEEWKGIDRKKINSFCRVERHNNISYAKQIKDIIKYTPEERRRPLAEKLLEYIISHLIPDYLLTRSTFDKILSTIKKTPGTQVLGFNAHAPFTESELLQRILDKMSQVPTLTASKIEQCELAYKCYCEYYYKGFMPKVLRDTLAKVELQDTTDAYIFYLTDVIGDYLQKTTINDPNQMQIVFLKNLIKQRFFTAKFNDEVNGDNVVLAPQQFFKSTQVTMAKRDTIAKKIQDEIKRQNNLPEQEKFYGEYTARGNDLKLLHNLLISPEIQISSSELDTYLQTLKENNSIAYHRSPIKRALSFMFQTTTQKNIQEWIDDPDLVSTCKI